MLEAASKYWWVVLIRGILAILFGILLFVVPGLTVASLVIVFGAYALVDGLFAIFYSISGRNTDKEWGKFNVIVRQTQAGIEVKREPLPAMPPELQELVKKE